MVRGIHGYCRGCLGFVIKQGSVLVRVWGRNPYRQTWYQLLLKAMYQFILSMGFKIAVVPCAEE